MPHITSPIIAANITQSNRVPSVSNSPNIVIFGDNATIQQKSTLISVPNITQSFRSFPVPLCINLKIIGTIIDVAKMIAMIVKFSAKAEWLMNFNKAYFIAFPFPFNLANRLLCPFESP